MNMNALLLIDTIIYMLICCKIEFVFEKFLPVSIRYCHGMWSRDLREE